MPKEVFLIIKDPEKRILAYIVLGTTYSLALALQIMSGTVLDFTVAELFFTCLVFTLAFAVILYNGVTALAFQMVFLFVFLLMFPGLKDYSADGKGAVHDLVTRVLDIYWYARGYLPYDDSYRVPLIAAGCLAVSAIAAAGLYAFFSFALLSAVGFSVFIVGWMSGSARSGTAFFIFLVCFIALLAKRLNSLRTTVKPARRVTGVALQALPAAAALVLAAAFLPNPGTSPDDLGAFFRRPIDAISDQVYLWFNPTYFSFQSTGFTGKGGRLGGKVTPNDRFIMRVKADERLYLAGAFYDGYTGAAWQNTGEYGTETDMTEYFSDYIETVSRLHGIRAISDSYVVGIPWFEGSNNLRHAITIDIGQSRTASLFQPPKAYGIDFSGQELIVLADENGALETDGVMLKDTSYTMHYISLGSVREEYLESVLMNSGKSRLWWLNVDGYEYVITLDAEEISRYLTLPDELPERVLALAEELTDGLRGEYAKAKAIESYLLKIPYTLSPENTPRDRDFVDYFLFDGKEGYCTYYASAMAVLCRAVGIPSRYVEGYVLPPTPSDDGYYYVTNNNAHSWAEIYIEGYGWAMLEATAPYHYAGAGAGASVADTPVFADSMVSDPYFYEHMNNLGLPEDKRRPAADTSAPRTAEEEAPAFPPPGFLAAFRIIVTVVVVTVFYYVIIWLYTLYRKYDYRRISRLPNEKQAEIYFSRLQKMCDYRFIYIRRGNETPAAHARRLGRRFVFRNETLTLDDVVNVIYKLRYSGKPLSDADAAVVRDGYLEMWEQIEMIKPRSVLVRDKWLMRL